ncbi:MULTISPECIES: Bug family tripartite tricarboxylate transporter substrate binding protein [Ramlibacter]|uniref:Tripartite tricarboxylate transporter substrate binding protein n=1 Tax=Ramlibacter pinisoli TaxID=2682844 RepID=A0A6N8IXF9_9BURK|nr:MULTISPECIES: tripartite tricarboxylate transporter substrate binding protein [Ramlibacter]MBA2961738.1 tripartite tricarboxylate transporter substrate binding protein [Ramlibacter sp. CGMCC 1.13660]MVQ31681.1 tripartite tricarboxylate transporter substrate binding protein [Ramlibacter pinisoli]
MRLFRRTLILAAVAIGIHAGASAQTDAYPNKPIEMIVPWPAGGGTDAIARVYAEAARTVFPQPILVVNKPGAIGSIGFAEAAAAKPDGYKVVMATPELLIAPYLGIGKASYEGFMPIARINADPSAITVKADAPWKTIEEFMAHARANSGKVTLSTSGNGAIPDIAALALEDKTGTKFTRVPYQGEAPAIQAILGGQVDATVVAPGALSAHVQAGKLRVLAVTSAQRIPEFKDVPTFKERGIDVAIGTWRGLLVPKGTPPEIVKRWSELTCKVIADPKYQETLQKLNVHSIYEDGETFAAVMKQDNEVFKRLVPKLQVTTK